MFCAMPDSIVGDVIYAALGDFDDAFRLLAGKSVDLRVVVTVDTVHGADVLWLDALIAGTRLEDFGYGLGGNLRHHATAAGAWLAVAVGSTGVANGLDAVRFRLVLRVDELPERGVVGNGVERTGFDDLAVSVPQRGGLTALEAAGIYADLDVDGVAAVARVGIEHADADGLPALHEVDFEDVALRAAHRAGVEDISVGDVLGDFSGRDCRDTLDVDVAGAVLLCLHLCRPFSWLAFVPFGNSIIAASETRVCEKRQFIYITHIESDDVPGCSIDRQPDIREEGRDGERAEGDNSHTNMKDTEAKSHFVSASVSIFIYSI